MAFRRDNYNLIGNLFYNRGRSQSKSLSLQYENYVNSLPENFLLKPPEIYRSWIPNLLYVTGRRGNILEVMFKPLALKNNSYIGMRGYDYFKDSGLPEEASWFYVESARVSANPETILGLDTTITSPLSTHIRQDTWRAGPRVRGNAAWATNNKYTTNINGEIIERNILEVIARPESDQWIKELTIPYSSDTNYFMNGTILFEFMEYQNTIFDRFYPYTYMLEGSDITRTAGRTRVNTINELPVKVDWSFLKGNPSTRNIIGFGNSGFQYELSNGFVLDKYDYTGIQNNEYELLKKKRGNKSTLDKIGREFIDLRARIGSSPQLRRYRFSLPSFNYRVTQREEDEYQNNNGNYAEAERRSELLSLLIDAAGLLNPLTFGATLTRLVMRAPSTYMSYINEEARKQDAENNFEGEDMPYIQHTHGTNYLTRLESGESQTITYPTRKLFYTKDNEKVYETGNPYVDIPINKLYKSVAEFRAEHPSVITSSYLKIQPYMDVGDFGKSYEIWAKIG